MPDVIVVGAGPAGRALAHRLVVHGVDVTVIDPAPDRPWVPTYACWTDELPSWLPDHVIAARVDDVRVFCPLPRRVDRGYTVLDTAALQHHLSLDGATVEAARAGEVAETTVTLADGRTVSAPVVFDARGMPPRGPRQTAYGMVVPRSEALDILDGAGAVIMDWRYDATDPSFLYVVPLDADRVLLEETCLAGAPPIPVRELRDRLSTRMGHRGFTVLHTEVVDIGLTGVSAQPWRQRPLPIGSAGGLTHPATGYSVATALTVADRLAVAVSEGRSPVAELWPTQARLVHRLRLAGLTSLLDMPADMVERFFESFFDLPLPMQRAYLSGRADLRGNAAAMWRLFVLADRPTRRRLVTSAVSRSGSRR